MVRRMHADLADKLRLHLADKNATWEGGNARWSEDGSDVLLVSVDGALGADAVLDAHLRARDANARLVLAHAGAASAVASRTAARFGIVLLDLTALPDPGPALPWDPATRAPEPELAHVEPIELLAMPWVHEMDPEPEVTTGGRSTRIDAPRPTLTPDWGLPWPRPSAPMDGVALADPRIWRAQDRIRAVREDLEGRGAPSFGAVTPEGSAWLKRLSHDL